MPATYNTSGSPKENLRGIRILCIALIAGVFVFMIVALVLRIMNYGEPFGQTAIAGSKADILLIICAGLAVACLFFAFTGFAKKITEIRKGTHTLNGKLGVYRMALTRYMALCEGPAIFGIIVFILTGYYYVLAVTVAGLAAMLLKAPFGNRAIAELSLDWKEQQELE